MVSVTARLPEKVHYSEQKLQINIMELPNI